MNEIPQIEFDYTQITILDWLDYCLAIESGRGTAVAAACISLMEKTGNIEGIPFENLDAVAEQWITGLDTFLKSDKIESMLEFLDENQPE